MLKSIRTMLRMFEKHNIIYCHWKSNEHIEEALLGDTDLDILFLPEQRSELERVLSECGLKRFRATPLMQYNAIEDYIGFDVDTAKIWHLHTHYRMTFGEKHLKGYTVTPWGYTILDNRVKNEFGIYTSCVEDELILFFVRNAMKLRFRDTFRSISKEDILELEWILKRVDLDKLKVNLKMFLNSESSDEILKLLHKKTTKKSQLKKLHKILCKELALYTGYTSFMSRWYRTQREIYWFIGAVIRHCGLSTNKPYRRVSPSGGCVVAILGCDGAGKSTTIAYLAKEFSKKLDVKTVYLGSGDGSSSLIRKPMKYIAQKVGGKGLGKSVENEYKMKSTSEEKISIKARLYSIAKIIWAYTLAIEKKSKLKEITKARNNGMLVLVDRYPQIEIQGCSDGPLLGRYHNDSNGLLRSVAEKELSIYKLAYDNPPDLTVKLMVPTEVAIQRKPEMTKEEIERKKNAVMQMNISRKSIVVDTTVSKNESFGKVMAAIWKEI